MLKNLLRRTLFVNDAFVHIEDAGRNIPCKLHLVSDDEHGEPLLGEVPDNRKDLPYHCRV